MSLREVIHLAGGALPVATKLGYSVIAVRKWISGERRPTSKGNVRKQLCKLAGVRVEDVNWENRRDVSNIARP